MAAADKKDKKDEEAGEAQVPEKKKSSALKWIIIAVVIVVVLAGAGAGAYFFLLKPKAPAAEKKPVEHEQAKVKVVVFYPMDPYIVNLADNEGERYLKVVMQLELSDQPVLEELNQIKPKIRDNIIELLSAKNYKDMMDTTGKQRLRDEIASRVNGYLTKGKVMKVYFTEFVIQ